LGKVSSNSKKEIGNIISNYIYCGDVFLRNIIEDNGTLICTQQENPVTGEIITTPQDDRCYSTSYSDVPYGSINSLCYKQEPLYYPRTRYTMNNSADKWPYGSKFIRY
jgi:hypothetical protein